MENKSKLYHNSTPKNFNNNMSVYNSMDNNKIVGSGNIREKIDNIINSDSFIYSKMVNIVIGNDIIKRRIIGVFNNNLLTINNEYILIDNIKDIYI